MTPIWEDVHLFYDGDAYFADLLRAIETSTVSVDLETYIFDQDKIGEKIEGALSRAVKRGVKARLLVDGVGSLTWIENNSRKLSETGVAVRVFHPVIFRSIIFRSILLWWPWYRMKRWIGWRTQSEIKGRRIVLRANRRTHRKICLIDGHWGYVGSINISEVHCLSQNGLPGWRDTAVRVCGPAIQDLEIGFRQAWVRAHTRDGKRVWKDLLLPSMRLSFPSLVRLNHTIGLRNRNFREFLDRIKKAHDRIWITNAYLAPSIVVIRHLTEASRRGVDVRVLVPRKSDVFFMPWVAAVHYEPLLKGGVRIFEYLPTFLHAKSILIDQWAVVGTSNMNRRSLLHDLEVDIVLPKGATVKILEKQFQLDLQSSEEISTRHARGWVRWLGRVFDFLLREWI